MTRIRRVVIPGVPHHVVQRGNRRQKVFFKDDDRRFYMRLLGRFAAEAGVVFWAYCLMENHVHLIAVPTSEDSLTKALGAAHWKYTFHINIREDWKGYLWQGRFFSCPLDGPYLLSAMRYVECNPVRAGLVRRAEDYPWSSARAHALKEPDVLVAKCPVEDEIKDWSGFLSIPAPEREVDVLRQNTKTGRPAGTQDFIRELEIATGRTLRALKRGRKPTRFSSLGPTLTGL